MIFVICIGNLFLLHIILLDMVLVVLTRVFENLVILFDWHLWLTKIINEFCFSVKKKKKKLEACSRILLGK